MERISIGQKSVDRYFPGLVSVGPGKIFSGNDTTNTDLTPDHE